MTVLNLPENNQIKNSWRSFDTALINYVMKKNMLSSFNRYKLFSVYIGYILNMFIHNIIFISNWMCFQVMLCCSFNPAIYKTVTKKKVFLIKGNARNKTSLNLKAYWNLKLKRYFSLTQQMNAFYIQGKVLKWGRKSHMKDPWHEFCMPMPS